MRGVPALARFGALLLSLGLFADLTLHALARDPQLGHLVTFVGMLLVVAGVTAQGLRARHPSASRSSHAHR